jgi:tetratricopeptide (TPR) repeat protein
MAIYLEETERDGPVGDADLLHSSLPWWLAVAALASAIALVFGRSLGFALLSWDDEINITRNPLLTPPSAASVIYFWLRPYVGLYAPVTYTVLAFEAIIAWRPEAAGGHFAAWVFHLGNLLFHTGAACAVYLILRRLTQHDLAALAGALMFALHPLQTESVCWATETKGLLAGLFSFLALWQYWLSTDDGAEHPRLHYAVALVAFVLALLSKPSAVVAPVVALTIDALWIGRDWRQSARALAPWFALSLVLMVATKWLQPDESLSVVAPLWQRPLVAIDAIGFYLWKLALPWRLAPDYGRTPGVALAGVWPYLSILLVAALGAAAAFAPARRRWLALGAVFVVSLAPVLGIVPFSYQQFSTVADRYAYLAMFAPALLTAWLLSRYPLPAVAGALAALIAAYGGISFVAAGHWRNDLALYTQANAVTERSLMAHNGLGNLLEQQGKLAEAEAHFRRAAELHPNSYSAHYNLGRVLGKRNRPAEGIAAIHKSLALRPDYEKAHFELARLAVRADQLPLARDHLQQAVRLDPERVDAWFNLAQVHERLGEREAAIRCYQETLKRDPSHNVSRLRIDTLRFQALPRP